MSGQLSVGRVVRRPIAFTVLVLGGFFSMLGVVSWFGSLHWTIELLSHFRAYYFLIGAALALTALALGLYGAAAVVGLVGLINGIAAWPYIAPPTGYIDPHGPPPVRLLWANLHNWGTDLVALRDLVEWEKPDIAIFTELAATHEPTLRKLRGLLPYQSTMNHNGPLDLMLLSKVAPELVHFDLTSGASAPVLVSRICVPGQEVCLTVLGLHTSRPFPHAGGARDRQLDYAASVARKHLDRGERVVLLGDLNVTPYSPVFHRMLAKSGLQDSTVMWSERPRGPLATWWVRNTGIGLPIDHALVGPGMRVAERRLGTPVGSDHLPLIIDLRVYAVNQRGSPH
jgi:endonuclease/exonuclease/phosphatase (EEP) superfamily protein YafD